MSIAVLLYAKKLRPLFSLWGNNQESNTDMPRRQRKLLGRYLVADPEICHGKPTFLGTRIMVAQVLEQVAEGMSWDEIQYQWHDNVSKGAISEAVHLAQRGTP